MSEARVDFETRSDIDLRRCGAGPYFASPHFKALITCYSIDGGPVQTWTYDQPPPSALCTHITTGGYIRAFNSNFERGCFDEQARRLGWPRPAVDRYRCTAAEAASSSLPRSLENVGEALNLPIKKDKRGTALIRKFSIPRRPRKGDNSIGPHWNEPEDFPEEFAEFVEYCRQDVLAEGSAANRLVPLSAEEQDLYTLDQIINSRGIRIDVRSARAALALADKAKLLLDREMRLVTGGYVSACSQPGKLVEWVQAQGVDMDTAQKAEIEELLELEGIPDNVRRAIELRQEAAKTSVSKLGAFIDRCSVDNRVRGAFLFLAAGTGRWSSTGAQVHNLPRYRKEFADAHLDQRLLFDAIRQADPDWLKFLYGDKLGRPLHLISDAIRGFIWAAPGHDLLAADYAGIEGAVAAWFAGEEWKLKAMHDLIANPEMPDLYRRAAAGIFNATTAEITKKDPRRQVGKVSELWDPLESTCRHASLSIL